MSPFASNLAGTHFLVTGGSKGIGRDMTMALLAEGANVSYCARNVTNEEFSSVETAAGAKAVGTKVDISDPEAIKAWVEKSKATFGRIDHVIANATPNFAAPDLDSWRKSFDADIIGLLTLINASLPHLEAAAAATKNASIVVISSLAGFERRLPEVVSPYTAFKRAQAIIARDYVRKVGPMGIRINIIIPGAIETPSITKPDGTTELSTFQESMKDHEEAFRQFFASMPLRRTGKPAEISNAAIFLASPLASYITGAELLIDGGLSMFL